MKVHGQFVLSQYAGALEFLHGWSPEGTYLSTTLVTIWNDVYFSDQKHPDLNKGYIKLRSEETKPVPEYYIHFTLARFENGRYNTLEYDYNKKITSFREEIPLPPGHYMLVTGNRLSDSKILVKYNFL